MKAKGAPMKKMSEPALKSMSESELRNTIRRFESKVFKLRKNSESTRELEEEICYAQREIELRRRFGHLRLGGDTGNDDVTLEFE